MAQHFNVIPRKQLCEKFGISSSTIKRWIKTRGFPQPLAASGQEPLFDSNAIQEWLEAMEVRND